MQQSTSGSPAALDSAARSDSTQQSTSALSDESLVQPQTSSPAALDSAAPTSSTLQESLLPASTISHDVDKPSTFLPECWTVEQYKHFTSCYTWLFVNDGKLGCMLCKNVEEIGPLWQDTGVRSGLSDEWMCGMVSPYGSTKSIQQTSLRKKINRHRNSASHKAAADIAATREKAILENSAIVQQLATHDETCRVFRTAYYVAKNDKPYTDHPDLIDLQKANGISVGRVLHSNVVCSDIIDHISTEMKHVLVKKMVALKMLMSVLVDESTALSRSSCLIVYVRATFDHDVGPVTFFLDILSLPATTADGIEMSLMQCLNANGFSDEYLRECFIGLAADGASVMLGKKNGVAAKLKARFPQLLTWHCLNHRLELSVGDAVKSCTEINQFKIFLDTLYALYSMSPKMQRELGECAKEVESQLYRIGRILDVRWVASSCRSVKALWQSYPALFLHFSEKVQADGTDARERAKFTGMKRKFQNPVFLKNLGLMYDALQELSDLSLALQKDSISLATAHRMICRQIEVFVARKETAGNFYAEACKAVEEGKFKIVEISASAGKEKEICKAQFYQALADSMRARLLPESESDLRNAVEILNPESWPQDMEVEYGEVELRVLCERFLMSMSEVKQDFKDSGGIAEVGKLKELKNRVNTLPVSTASCERGFSKMNVVCTAYRTRLTVSHMAALMFISLSGPPLNRWDPLPYVKTWVARNRRDATSTRCPERAERKCEREQESLWMMFC